MSSKILKCESASRHFEQEGCPKRSSPNIVKISPLLLTPLVHLSLFTSMSVSSLSRLLSRTAWCTATNQKLLLWSRDQPPPITAHLVHRPHARYEQLLPVLLFLERVLANNQDIIGYYRYLDMLQNLFNTSSGCFEVFSKSCKKMSTFST